MFETCIFRHQNLQNNFFNGNIFLGGLRASFEMLIMLTYSGLIFIYCYWPLG